MTLLQETTAAGQHNKDKGYAKLMARIQSNLDHEEGHVDADDLLCVILIELGFYDTVEEYQKVMKWYA